MSAYWDVYCLGCKEGLGLHGNHQEEGANSIAAVAEDLAVLGIRVPDAKLAAESFGFYSNEGGNPFPAVWFAKHSGHKVVARSEYGQISNRCAHTDTCTTCGHWTTCNRDPSHHHTHGGNDPVVEKLAEAALAASTCRETDGGPCGGCLEGLDDALEAYWARRIA